MRIVSWMRWRTASSKGSSGVLCSVRTAMAEVVVVDAVAMAGVLEGGPAVRDPNPVVAEIVIVGSESEVLRTVDAATEGVRIVANSENVLDEAVMMKTERFWVRGGGRFSPAGFDREMLDGGIHKVGVKMAVRGIVACRAPVDVPPSGIPLILAPLFLLVALRAQGGIMGANKRATGSFIMQKLVFVTGQEEWPVENWLQSACRGGRDDILQRQCPKGEIRGRGA